MDREELTDELIRLAELGYPVFPCVENGKRPAVKGGLNSATRDAGQIRAWVARFPGANWAIAIPAEAIVIDIDSLDDGTPNAWPRNEAWAESLIQCHAMAITPKGGKHIWYSQEVIGRWRNTGSAIAPQVDTRGPGGYVLIPPSKTFKGAYQWVEGFRLENPPDRLAAPPVWLAELLDKAKPVTRASSSGSLPLPNLTPTKEVLGRGVELFTNTSERYQQKALALLLENGALVAGTKGETVTLVRPGKSIEAGTSGTWNAPESRHGARGGENATGFPRLTVFSSNWHPFIGGTSYSSFDILQILTPPEVWPTTWANLCAHYQAALDAEFGVEFEDEETAIEDGEDEQAQEPAMAPQDPDAPPGEPFPSALIERAPGFLGQFVEYANQTAFKQQPVLALAAAICLQGLLAGRKIQDKRRTRTNIYAIGVADSGEGKEGARALVKRILAEAGGMRLFGESIASGAAIIKVIEQDKVRIYLADEIGRALKAIASPNASPHQHAIITVLMRLYSSASSIFCGDDYADRKLNMQIVEPHVCLYGTTVPRSLFDSFTHESVTDGFLARVCFFHGSRGTPINFFQENLPIPRELVDHAKAWLGYQAGGLMAVENPSPLVVPETEDAQVRFRLLEEYCNAQAGQSSGGVSSLWHRCVEKARQFALVYAAARFRPGLNSDPAELVIDDQATDWAADLAIYLTRRLVADCQERIGETRFESDTKKIEAFIAASPEGRRQSDITKRFRHMRKATRDEALATLVESGLVRVTAIGSGGRGRPGCTYKTVQSLTPA